MKFATSSCRKQYNTDSSLIVVGCLKKMNVNKSIVGTIVDLWPGGFTTAIRSCKGHTRQRLHNEIHKIPSASGKIPYCEFHNNMNDSKNFGGQRLFKIKLNWFVHHESHYNEAQHHAQTATDIETPPTNHSIVEFHRLLQLWVRRDVQVILCCQVWG